MTTLQTALQSGAVLTAQYSTSTGFQLHLSYPLIEGVPHLQAEDVSLEAAFAKLDTAVRDEAMAEHEFAEANTTHGGRGVNPYL